MILWTRAVNQADGESEEVIISVKLPSKKTPHFQGTVVEQNKVTIFAAVDGATGSRGDSVVKSVMKHELKCDW